MKVLILTSSSGGGHDMRANAFKAWAESDACREAGLEVCVHQALEDTTLLYRFGVGIYNFIQKTLPYLQYIYYQTMEFVGATSSAWKIVGADGFMGVVRNQRPDIVLSTHDHLNHGFFDLARTALPETPPVCVTYCGELEGTYGFSRWWVNPDADLFIGAVEETGRAAEYFGMSAKRVWQGGFLLYPPFYAKPLSSSEREGIIRSEWSFDPSRFILLLATGANAANNHLRLLSALARARIQVQVLVLCGKSDATRNTIEQFALEHPDIPIRALGYSDEMSELMQCASAIVARPGTGTTSEAIQTGCPILFNGIGGIMPQEVITVRYCRNHGVGRVFGNARGFIAHLTELVNEPETLQKMEQAQALIRPRRTPADILERVVALARGERQSDEA